MKKLLIIEVIPRGEGFFCRYDIFRESGAEVFLLTTANTPSDYSHFSGITVAESQTLEAVVAAAQQWHEVLAFDAIITTDEASVVSAGAVADTLSLPGIGLQAALKSRNKYAMRLAHRAGDAPHPQFRLCEQLQDALAAADDIGYPVIIKPTLGAISEHVFLIGDADKMRAQFPVASRANAAHSFSEREAATDLLGTNTMLVEEFLDGSEHCVEAWVRNGSAHIGSIADRISEPLEVFDNDFYKTPTSLSEQQIAMLQQALQAGVQAQGIEHGVVHAEFRFHKGRPQIVEIAARVGGGSLFKMAQIAYGYCPIEAAYQVALDRDPSQPNMITTGKIAVGLTMLCGEGRVWSIRVPESLKTHPRVFNFDLIFKVGDYVTRPPNGNDIFGYIGVWGDSLADAVALAEEMFGLIEVELEAEAKTSGSTEPA